MSDVIEALLVTDTQASIVFTPVSVNAKIKLSQFLTVGEPFIL